MKLAENDDWNAADAPIHAGAGAFAFPAGSKDAALIQTLPPGPYTVHLRSSPNSAAQTGIGLVEIFELGESTAATTSTRLVNLSTRARVGTGQDILIPGIVVGPPGVNNANVSRGVLIRAVGPGLADFGVNGTLQYPRIKVVFGNGVVAAENIGWQSAANQAALIAATTRVGAFPLGANRADSALLLSLIPMPYTVQVSGADGGTGVALVEIYEVP